MLMSLTIFCKLYYCKGVVYFLQLCNRQRISNGRCVNRSLIITRKSIGPSIVPCGVPPLTVRQLFTVYSLQLVLGFLSFATDCMHQKHSFYFTGVFHREVKLSHIDLLPYGRIFSNMYVSLSEVSDKMAVPCVLISWWNVEILSVSNSMIKTMRNGCCSDLEVGKAQSDGKFKFYRNTSCILSLKLKAIMYGWNAN